MTSRQTDRSPARNGLLRRDVIKGAAGLAGTATLGAAAIPTIASSQPAGAHVRQDITAFARDASRLAKFEGAIREMQERSRKDRNDPKGWLVNARAHADFCSIAAEAPKQIHFCWWFLPWHRAYIAVTERKIREIAGDQALAYPYWNWSSDRHIPQAFARAGSPLANAVRDTPNRAVQDNEVGYFPNDPAKKKLGVEALGMSVFEAKNSGQISRSFGGIARPNPSNRYGNNAIESVPHGPIHNYVGGYMADFDTAARDPIFFAHHGNLDRLWETWRSVKAHKDAEPKVDAFLKHPFAFTWLDGTTVQITVEETLDTKKLGYTYDTLDVFRPGAQMVASAQGAEERLPAIATDKVRAPVSAEAAGPERHKILEITDVENPGVPMTVGVYVKPANAPPDDPGISVGSFASVRAGGQIVWPTQTLSFDITDAVNRYAGQELTVQLIPNRIRAQGVESLPNLKYGQMRIVTETP